MSFGAHLAPSGRTLCLSQPVAIVACCLSRRRPSLIHRFDLPFTKASRTTSIIAMPSRCRRSPDDASRSRAHSAGSEHLSMHARSPGGTPFPSCGSKGV